MTGCLEGKVPSISPEEALSLGEIIKVVNKNNGFPIYAELVGIDYGTNHIVLMSSDSDRIVLPLNDCLFFKAQKLDHDVPREIDSAIVIGGELFTVVHNDPIPVWLGHKNLVYYADDIQQLKILAGGFNLLSDGLESGQ